MIIGSLMISFKEDDWILEDTNQNWYYHMINVSFLLSNLSTLQSMSGSINTICKSKSNFFIWWRLSTFDLTSLCNSFFKLSIVTFITVVGSISNTVAREHILEGGMGKKKVGWGRRRWVWGYLTFFFSGVVLVSNSSIAIPYLRGMAMNSPSALEWNFLRHDSSEKIEAMEAVF